MNALMFGWEFPPIMRTRIIITLCFILGIIPVLAQEAGKLRVGLDAGCLLSKEIGFRIWEGGFGLLGAIELKYNLNNAMNVGFKTETAAYMRNESDEAKTLSFAFTYDYYFHSTGRRSSPFAGAGLGYYFCENYNFSKQSKYYNNPAFFIRAGSEIWKFRLSLTYNFIRKPNAIIYNHKNNDYLSLTVGFYLGGGKWK